MRVVVADTGPLLYLILLGQIELLPALFTGVTVPTEVCAELVHVAAPHSVWRWAANPPTWLAIASAPAPDDPRLVRLGTGEAAAIALALSLEADLVLMDDRAGVAAARAKGLDVIGTIGVLEGRHAPAGRHRRRGGTAQDDELPDRPRLLDELVARHIGGNEGS